MITRHEQMNADLIEVMNAYLATNLPELEARFVEELYQAQFITPVIVAGVVKGGKMVEEGDVSLKTLANEEEERYLMAFTDFDELKKWSQKEEKTVLVTYADLRQMVLGYQSGLAGFVINPYEQSVVITPNIMAFFEKLRPSV